MKTQEPNKKGLTKKQINLILEFLFAFILIYFMITIYVHTHFH